jgi:GntP family gluconate:H+ symporter
MSDVGILVNTGVAIVAIVVLIVKFKINPVVSLVVGSMYLGLVANLGLDKTISTITTGFGDIMAEVGLLIAFGVLMGAMLQEMGAIQRLVGVLLRVFGPKRLPYTLALTIATALQSIYLDVLLVISAPLAKTAAGRIGDRGTARMATAMAIGLECGIVLMVPGVGSLALAALLDVPLGQMLVWGLVLVIPTVTIAIAIMSFLFRHGFWNEELDEDAVQERMSEAETERVLVPAGADVVSDDEPATAATPGGGIGHAPARQEAGIVPADGSRPAVRRDAPLLVLFLPLLAALVLIATGAIAEAVGSKTALLGFIADPVFALLVGLVGTGLVSRWVLGQDRTEKAIAHGFRESGQILILTAVGGSLAAVVAADGLGDILQKYFSASTFAPLLIVWGIAALLHLAVGSVTISAITAAGILAPIAPSLGLDPVMIALAAGSGSLFGVHVTSNTFWLLQSLMGQTTRGALKTCTVGVSVASVVAILLLMPISLVA